VYHRIARPGIAPPAVLSIVMVNDIFRSLSDIRSFLTKFQFAFPSDSSLTVSSRFRARLRVSQDRQIVHFLEAMLANRFGTGVQSFIGTAHLPPKLYHAGVHFFSVSLGSGYFARSACHFLTSSDLLVS
jgi:hypothetical protein